MYKWPLRYFKIIFYFEIEFFMFIGFYLEFINEMQNMQFDFIELGKKIDEKFALGNSDKYLILI